MFKKISDWIKNLFSKKEEMDPHEELMLHVPEPEIPLYNHKLEKINKKHKKDSK